MAVVVRGWSKTASTAVKLATAERIIGYQFNHVDKLYEALDQTGRRVGLPSGATLRPKKPRNTRLALVGDVLAKLHVTQDWYARECLGGAEFSEIQASTLSNQHLGKVGFRLGLDECAISKEIVKEYDMATTMEAVIAAVHMDGASKDQVRKICVRFGLEHKLLDPAERLWIWEMVESERSLPDKFFIGHHLKIQEGIFATQLKRLTSLKKQDIGLWGRAKLLWWPTKTLWQPHKKTELLGEVSGGHHQDDEKAAASEKTTDGEDLAERHEIAVSSTSAVPMPTQSNATKRQTLPVLLHEHMSTDDVKPAEIGSQDSSITSHDVAAPTPFEAAANGVGKQVKHPAGQSSEVDYAEATKNDDSKKRLQERAEQMLQEATEIQKAILQIGQAGDEMTQEDEMKIQHLHQERQEILDRRSRILNPKWLQSIKDTTIDRS